MDIFYIDESGDYLMTAQGTRGFVMSALAIPEESWNTIFTSIKDFRVYLRNRYGIRLAKELHACDFLAGRGVLGPKVVPKGARVQIFQDALSLFAAWDGVGAYVVNVYITNGPGKPARDYALERLLNRINRTLLARGRYGILVFDEGRELDVRRMMRRMRVFNPVPSRYGQWPEGSPIRNITTDRILGDPFFRRSEDDYFVQAVDFIAYALLKQEEPPTARITRYGLNTMFRVIDPILYRPACPSDPQGISRG